MTQKRNFFSLARLQDLFDQSSGLADRLNSFLLYLSTFGVLVFLYDIGFEHAAYEPALLRAVYNILFVLVLVSMTLRMVLLLRKGYRHPSLVFEGLLLGFLAFALVGRLILRHQMASASTFLRFFESDQFVYGVIIYVFLVEFSKKTLLFYRSNVHPAQLFVLSFIFLITLGTGLLLLPQATFVPISFIDALFTSTSAVCVTGLVTLDTATVFTPTGKVIILILIQIGAFGIMTFASFFGVFFQGTSLKSALFMKDWINEDNLSQITRTLIKIVALSLGIEAIGALLVYLSLGNVPEAIVPDKLSFAVFHAVSAFCNAGFSTLSLGLYDPALRFNYALQLAITLLVIMGGLGFPIVFHLYRSASRWLGQFFRGLVNRKQVKHMPRLFNVNTRLVGVTTAWLLGAGTVLYFLLEYHNTLAEHSLTGKIVGAFFGAVTPRTAGFNTVDMAALSAPTILLYLLLMWIGASPASVGGGIKTTTFAVALLNIVSLARGKNRVEVYRREIDAETVQKAFALVLLSLLVIGLSIFLVIFFDPQFSLLAVAFESFSGFSTVGLSVGITAKLSVPSKIVMILTMLVGRVGTLTLIIGLFRKVSSLRYRYPKENIIIT